MVGRLPGTLGGSMRGRFFGLSSNNLPRTGTAAGAGRAGAGRAGAGARSGVGRPGAAYSD
jgi:hypothetical protein